MKRALFISKNLIGDGMQISRPLSQWHRENPEYSIDLLTLRDHVTCIYPRMGVPLTVVFEPEGGYQFQHTFDPSAAFAVCDRKRCHIAEGYAELLMSPSTGRPVQLPFMPNFKHLHPIFIPTPETLSPDEKGLFMVSMFSASCSSRSGGRPNKMLPWATWRVVLEHMVNRLQITPTFLGAPDDRAPELPFGEECYKTGIPLNRLAWIMKESALVLTIDNGMSHLASSQNAKEVLLYPACLGTYYIVPVGNPNLGVLQMEPNTVKPESLITGIDMILNKLGFTD